MKKAEKVKNFDQTSGSNLGIKPPYALHAHNGARRALGWCIRARASHFCAKKYAATSFVETTVVYGSVFSDNFCATRIDPWYLYEASLKIVGFVLLHKVLKEKTDRGVFRKFHCKFSDYRLADSVT